VAIRDLIPIVIGLTGKDEHERDVKLLIIDWAIVVGRAATDAKVDRARMIG